MKMPGIYRDVPANEYHEVRAASNSLLGAFKRSPAHAKQMMDEPRRPTDAMILGTATHYAVLQPELFRQLYVVADQCNGQTGKGKRCSYNGSVMRSGQWFCATHDPRKGEPEECACEVLTSENFDKCLRIADAVHAHKAARAVLRNAQIEVSALWQHEASGALCKMRSDILGDGGIVGDLKTTQDASRDAFERSIFGFGYYRQAAHYLSGLDCLGHEAAHFCIVAVEALPPFAVAVYRLQDDVIDAGRNELDELLSRWAECDRAGVWPGYSEAFEDIGLPAWGWKQLEQVG